MLFDDITLIEGADISNLTVASGPLVDRGSLIPSEGELFFQTDNDSGFYVYSSGVWTKIGTGNDVSSHANDQDLHLTVNQNSFMDGITVTFDKVNYLSTVTSDIQTQLDLKSDISTVLLKDGSVELSGTFLPEMTGAISNVSTRNIGSPTQQINSIYADKLFLGASALYLNGKKVIEDVSNTITFSTNANQALIVGTSGIGGLALTTDNAILNLTSTQNEINMSGAGGINANVGSSLSTKHISFSNASTGGNITFTTSGTSSNIQLSAVNEITLTAPIVRLTGTVSTDVYTDLDSTIGTLVSDMVVHNHDASYVNISGDTLTGSLILANSPVVDNEAVTKSYVDSLVTGLDTKDSVIAATTNNISLTGSLTIDGILTVPGDRILVKNQINATENGIYVVNASAWLRSEDADNTPSNEVSGGMYCFVESGSVNADTGWTLSSPTGNAILGTDNLSFVKFSNVTAPVNSVNGHTGTVTLVASDLSLGNIDNVSDLDKVISTLTQTALDGKVDDGQVLTNVPAGALFTDTTYSNATTSVAGLMSSADKTKIDTIETNAKDDQTASEILTLIKTVDGSSSGLDADLLDGLNSNVFARSDINDIISGKYNFTNASGLTLGTDGAIVIGLTNALNLGLDTNEIQARSNGSASNVHINRLGGTVNLGDASSTVSVLGDIDMVSTQITTTASRLVVDQSSNGVMKWQTTSQFISNHAILVESAVIDGGTF